MPSSSPSSRISAVSGPSPGSTLPPGEFPQAAELLALGPLADQHPPVRVDQGDRYDEKELHDR